MSTYGNAILASPMGNARGRFYQIVGAPYGQFLALRKDPEGAIKQVKQQIAELHPVKEVVIETVFQDLSGAGQPTPTIASVAVTLSEDVNEESLDTRVGYALVDYTDMYMPVVPLDQPIVHYEAHFSLV